MAEIFDFYINDNRSITFKLSEPIMLEDNGVSDWRFHIPNTVNGLDATGWQWWLVYVNAKNEKYTIPLTLEYDYDRPDAYSIATYTVDYGMSCKVGNVKFSIEAIDADTGGTILHEWHTKTYTTNVVDTLQGNQVEYAETESDIISALLIEVRNRVNQLVGGATPTPVSSVSEMLDTDKLYLLTTDGEWYYYNGTTWVSGGVYGAGVTDAVPTQGSAHAVSSGGVYDALQSAGLSEGAKTALLACFEHVAWSTPNGDSYYQALADALEDEGSYIGELAFPIFAESSPSDEQRYTYDSETGRMRIEPTPSDVRNRVACDISGFALHVGDLITLGDSTTYAFAIGVNDSWIGGGYLSDYPFVVQSGDIPSIKEILVKRNDNADFTQADIDYLKAHIKLKRTVNKYLDRISVSYNHEIVHLPADAPTFVRPDLTVTAYYSDGTSENVTLYRLITNVSTGTNAVTIGYGSKTASVNVNMVEQVYFLKTITLDNGAYRWGNSGETPSENSGYLLGSTAVDNVSANISNIPFYAGDTIYFAFLDEFKYAIGTNVTDTSYNNRLWIGGGYFADASYTLQEADVSDMKVFYVRAKDNTTNIQTDAKKKCIMQVYVERVGA